tara:strand:+ start:1284 stop:1430 length:147 start_codon:yes stop_codon:yes gene_type:complete
MIGADVKQGLAGGDHLNSNRLEIIGKNITGPQSTITWKLQQDISSTSC